MTKIDILSKYIDLPLFRVILRRLFNPLHFFHFAKMIEAQRLSKYITDGNRGKVCDIACGCGEHCIQLADKGYEAYGIDLDKESIKIANKLSQGKCNYIIADAENLPFKQESFNKLISLGSLEHFEDGERAINEMKRVLKPKGILALTVDSFNFKGSKKSLKEKHKTRHHVVKFYSLLPLTKQLEENELTVEDAGYYIKSSLSAFFFNLNIRNVWASMLLFPISYILASISDSLSGTTDEGYFLAIKAKKISEKNWDLWYSAE